MMSAVSELIPFWLGRSRREIQSRQARPRSSSGESATTGVEMLENRRHFTFGVTDPNGLGDYTIKGSLHNDDINVTMVGTTAEIIDSTSNQRQVIGAWPDMPIRSLNILARAGEDSVKVTQSQPPGVVIGVTIVGGNDHDYLETTDVDTAIIYGDDSNDLLNGSWDSIYIENARQFYADGMVGNDIIVATFCRWVGGEDGNHDLFGNDGDDELDASIAGCPVRVIGGYGNDIMHGSEAADFMDGGPGVDRINANGGNDTIEAYDFSEDVIDGGAGYDWCRRNHGGDDLQIYDSVIRVEEFLYPDF